MTDEQIDLILVSTLKKILDYVKDDAAYIQETTDPVFDDIKQDYEDTIYELEAIVSEIKSLDDLAVMDEEAITAVYEYLDTYAAYMVCVPEDQKPEFDKTMKEYNELQVLLNLFNDVDEDEEDFEE